MEWIQVSNQDATIPTGEEVREVWERKDGYRCVLSSAVFDKTPVVKVRTAIIRVYFEDDLIAVTQQKDWISGFNHWRRYANEIIRTVTQLKAG